jgi:hypothetical protein
MLDILRKIRCSLTPAMDQPVKPALLSSASFNRQLLLERDRSDRSGMDFSLLVFEIGNISDAFLQEESESVLSNLLLEKTRVIDTKGWHRDALAVILPYTAEAESEVVWEKISRAFEERISEVTGGRLPAPELACELYPYPGEEGQAVGKRRYRRCSA